MKIINKDHLKKVNLIIIVIIFVTSILIVSSSNLSFAKENNENKDDNKDIKQDISISSSIEKESKKNHKVGLKEKIVQNDTLSNVYPNQFYICGYPQQLIASYNSFETFKDCNS